MSTKFATKTTVSSEKSRMEIEQTLARYGASHFMYGSSPDRAVVAFQASGRRIKFELPLPDRESREFTHVRRARQNYDTKLTDIQAQAAWEQAGRQRWRALLLVIKAKLEAVEAEITTFEQEFLAHIMLPNGQTVGDAFIPSIAKAYETGDMPAMQIGWDG